MNFKYRGFQQKSQIQISNNVIYTTLYYVPSTICHNIMKLQERDKTPLELYADNMDIQFLE